MGMLLLVRHGQASFGAADYDVLSPTGLAQARTLGQWLAGQQVVPDVVVTGSLRRHRDTAEELAAGAGPPGWPGQVSVDADWDEFDHLALLAALHPDGVGDDQAAALDRREFQRQFEAATTRWTTATDPGAYPESWPTFLARVTRALDRACGAATAGRTVLVVSSGGPIAACCAALLEPERDPDALAGAWSRLNTVTVNAALTRVVVGATGARLLTFNEHPHLAAEQVTYR